MSSLRTLSVPVRPVLRSSAARRACRGRFQSTTSNASNAGSGGSTSRSSHLAAGVAGGTAAALASYGLYTLTPAGRLQRRINSAAYEADKTYKKAATKVQETTPNSQQALDSLREAAYSYASFIPGGRGYVDIAFKDLDTLREGHGEEIDKIVRETYDELKEVSKGSLNTDTLNKLLEVASSFSKKVGRVAADGLSDLVDNHPQVKEKLGPGVDQLKQLGESLGPEAKKQVEQTWDQVGELLQGGFSVQNVQKMRQLIQEKVDAIKKLGDKAWNEGMEQAKPMLDKNPKIKQMVEENADALKQGNAMELFQKVKDSVQSGNSDDLQQYINSAVSKAKQSTGGGGGGGLGLGGFEKYLSAIPGGSEILPKLGAISNLSQQDTKEAEQLLKETVDKLKDILTQQSQKAEDLVKKSTK